MVHEHCVCVGDMYCVCIAAITGRGPEATNYNTVDEAQEYAGRYGATLRLLNSFVSTLL